jgi:hypothetical protein
MRVCKQRKRKTEQAEEYMISAILLVCFMYARPRSPASMSGKGVFVS